MTQVQNGVWAGKRGRWRGKSLILFCKGGYTYLGVNSYEKFHLTLSDVVKILNPASWGL